MNNLVKIGYQDEQSILHTVQMVDTFDSDWEADAYAADLLGVGCDRVNWYPVE
jgi:hypothetical protein